MDSLIHAGLIVGPIAGLTLIAGNVGVILGLFPAHVTWTVYTVAKYIFKLYFSYSPAKFVSQ